ncbi:MAG: hypothetical protein ITD40_00985 [Nitrosarchaeum sp.]|nr:hypothetical protein [Nitrosarchaeum sp.]
MDKLSKNLRICGVCGIVYASVSLTKYIDSCPMCNCKRYESIPIKTDMVEN